MKTYKQALARAKQRAKETGEARYVIYDPYAEPGEGGPYFITTDEGLETYFFATSPDRILAYVLSDGTVETE